MDFLRTATRSRKHLSYISVLLNKIINKQKTSKKIWTVPLPPESPRTLLRLEMVKTIHRACQV